MNLDDVLKTAVKPAYALLPLLMNSERATVLLLAIGLQESGFATRVQMNDGPARGFWQFEQFGGVKGVYKHAASTAVLRDVCAARDVAFTIPAIYKQLAIDDVLAAACARLLLFTDPKPLPSMLDTGAAWDYYDRNWQPGKPRPATWAANYKAAIDAVTEGLTDG